MGAVNRESSGRDLLAFLGLVVTVVFLFATGLSLAWLWIQQPLDERGIDEKPYVVDQLYPARERDTVLHRNSTGSYNDPEESRSRRGVISDDIPSELL